PIPLSLFAMAVVASASAVIYWSAPLSKRQAIAMAEQSTPIGPIPDLVPEMLPELAAAAQPEQKQAPLQPSAAIMLPEEGSIGTRADSLVTGQLHETDLLTGLLGPEAFFALLARGLPRCSDANLT